MAADFFLLPPGDRPYAVKLAALGMITGALGWVLVDSTDRLNLHFELEGPGLLLLPISVYPGLVFGLVFGALLRLRVKVSCLRAIGYVLAAGLGYLAAFHVAFQVIANDFSDAATPLAYIAGGIPGGLTSSLVLGLLTKFLLKVPGRLVLRRPAVIGAVAGALLGLASFDNHNGLGFLAFFILWQGAYAASLAPLLRRSADPATS